MSDLAFNLLVPRQAVETTSAVSASRSRSSASATSGAEAAASGSSGSGRGSGSGPAVATASTTAAAAAASGKGSAAAASSAASNGTAAATTQTHGHGGGGKATDYSPYYAWYSIAGAVAILFLLRIRRLLVAWWAQRRARSSPRSSGQGSPSSSSPPSLSGAEKKKAAATVAPFAAGRSGRGPLVRSYAATAAVWDNLMYIRVFPLWIYSSSNTAELLWTAAYIGIALGIAFWASWNNGNFKFRNPIAHMALYQIPIIVGLASKNNVISFITGVSYQKLNYLHRAAGRTCCLCAWVHAFQWIHDGLQTKSQPGTLLFQSGAVAFIALNIMLLSSFAIVRRVMYEAFLVIHIVFALVFILGAYYHAPQYATFCWAGLIPWALDRVVGLLKMFVINSAWLMPFRSRRGETSNCTLELVDHDVIRITAKRPLLRWTPGQHAYVTMPTIATLRYEQHPFTIGNILSASGDVVFLVRAHHGFTKKLREKLTSDVTTDLPLYLDGPYGNVSDMSHHGTVVMVAGGTGITYALSIFLGIVAAAKKGKVATTRLRLIWNVRHTAHIAWIAPLLNEHLATGDLGASGVDIRVDVHVTRSVLSDEGEDERGLTDAIAHPHEHGDSHHHGHAHSNSVGSAEILSSPASPPLSSHPSSTGLSTPGLEAYSPEGSSEVVNEKTVAQAQHGRDLRAERVDGTKFGLEAASTAFVTFHSGRSNLKTAMAEHVGATQTTMGVGVCGPSALQLDVRRAITHVNSASSVFKGQAPIDLHVERFGW